MDDQKGKAAAAGSNDTAATRGSLSTEVAVAQPSKDGAPPAREPQRGGDDAGNARDYLCGAGRYRPQWMQAFATPKWYAVILAMLGTCQGAYRMYLTGTLSTIERRFSLSSRQSAFIMIGDDISPILANIALIIFLKRTSKPNWVSAGMFCCFLGTLCNLLPYVVYGPSKRYMTYSSGTKVKQMDFCGSPANSTSAACGDAPWFWGHSVGPVLMMFTGNFLNGLGTTTYYTIGSTYMDDNVEKSYTAAYFGYVMVFRLIGPVLGFALAFLTLRYPEDLAQVCDSSRAAEKSGGERLSQRTTSLKPGDPRWIGAWWFGYIFIALGILMGTIPMFLFPKKMRTGSEKNKEQVGVESSTVKRDISELIKGLGRLTRNPVYMFRMFHSVAAYIATGGYALSFPRYAQHQFAQSASSASLLAGVSNILSHVIGIGLGSMFVHLLKPSPRVVGMENTSAAAFAALSFLGIMTITCSSIHYPLTHDSNDRLTIRNECNEECDCSTSVYHPVCDMATRKQYFSACFAGCPRGLLVNELEALSVFTSWLASLSNAAFIPYPLIYGALTDASCIVWEDRCGERGACWIYDLPKMRYLINGFTTLMLCLSTFFQCVMTYYCKRIKNFHGDDEAAPGEKPKPIDKTGKDSGAKESPKQAPSVKKHGSEAQARENEEPAVEEPEPPAHEPEHSQGSRPGSRKPSVSQGSHPGSRKGSVSQGSRPGSLKGSVSQGSRPGSRKGSINQGSRHGSRKGSVESKDASVPASNVAT
ncbi:solute carrier organic anion transporter family member 4C1 [Rhipicephalus sanguineus]|uniref:solute carrier organic anion transporter family member 4C1 n=1 Tax=Rhipicephalus sanguineus TaxID=34632 RepID=UPI0020C52FA5|nr:solute carrier organic anion transporter family member 4C1 [Rhipicephalus sanguineus]